MSDVHNPASNRDPETEKAIAQRHDFDLTRINFLDSLRRLARRDKVDCFCGEDHQITVGQMRHEVELRTEEGLRIVAGYMESLNKMADSEE